MLLVLALLEGMDIIAKQIVAPINQCVLDIDPVRMWKLSLLRYDAHLECVVDQNLRNRLSR